MAKRSSSGPQKKGSKKPVKAGKAPVKGGKTPVKAGKAPVKGGKTPIRFAHPFFTNTPAAKRPPTPAGKQMLDHIQGTLNPIPPLVRNQGRWTLDEVIGKDGAAAIQAAGKITLHICGDTGVPDLDRPTRQVSVADAMTLDYNADAPDRSPACLFHLGDVIYGQSAGSYLEQFYRPYMHYPGKIIAIPGNHDGDVASKMTDFETYFCATSQTVPPVANSIFRETMTQPGVYWFLDAPFVQIVGLYSNSAENPGFISAPSIGTDQKTWLVSVLQEIKKDRAAGNRKALLMATHHPPFSSGGHSGSSEMLKDILDACDQAGGIMPDAYLSGHAHSIQRYAFIRTVNGRQTRTPFIVSGCGGHGGQTVSKAAPGKVDVDHSYEFAYAGWGYTKADITVNSLTLTSYSVDWTTVEQIDQVVVPLA